MKWILILYVINTWHGNAAITSAEFESEEACRIAATSFAIETLDADGNVKVKSVCVKNR